MKIKPYRTLLPENAVVMYGIRIVGYLDEDGVEQHDWILDGDVRLGQIVGALEIIKTLLIATAKETVDDD